MMSKQSSPFVTAFFLMFGAGGLSVSTGLSASSTPIARNVNHQGTVAEQCTNANSLASALQITLQPGRYVVVVESYGSSSVPGAFTLTMACTTRRQTTRPPTMPPPTRPPTMPPTRPPVPPGLTDPDDPCHAVGCSTNCEEVIVSTPSLRIDVTWNRANDMVRWFAL